MKKLAAVALVVFAFPLLPFAESDRWLNAFYQQTPAGK